MYVYSYVAAGSLKPHVFQRFQVSLLCTIGVCCERGVVYVVVAVCCVFCDVCCDVRVCVLCLATGKKKRKL